MSEISAHVKIDELERELAMRQQFYPRQVRQGVLSDALAARRIAIIKAIISDYRRQVQIELFEESP